MGKWARPPPVDGAQGDPELALQTIHHNLPLHWSLPSIMFLSFACTHFALVYMWHSNGQVKLSVQHENNGHLRHNSLAIWNRVQQLELYQLRGQGEHLLCVLRNLCFHSILHVHQLHTWVTIRNESKIWWRRALFSSSDNSTVCKDQGVNDFCPKVREPLAVGADLMCTCASPEFHSDASHVWHNT